MSGGMRVILAVLCASTLLIGACSKNAGSTTHGAQADRQLAREAPRVNWAIELTGSGLDRPVTFTYEQLAQMKMLRLEDVIMLQTHGPDKHVTCAGPPLDDLLTAAAVKPGPMTVTFEAADGYKRQCKREDLRSAIIALKDGEGRWLADVDRNCPLQLTPPHLPGDDWVKNVQRITVEPAGDS